MQRDSCIEIQVPGGSPESRSLEISTSCHLRRNSVLCQTKIFDKPSPSISMHVSESLVTYHNLCGAVNEPKIVTTIDKQYKQDIEII